MLKSPEIGTFLQPLHPTLKAVESEGAHKCNSFQMPAPDDAVRHNAIALQQDICTKEVIYYRITSSFTFYC